MKRIFWTLTTLLALTLYSSAYAAVDCDRECLKGFLNTYLQALADNDSSELPVTRNVWAPSGPMKFQTSREAR